MTNVSLWRNHTAGRLHSKLVVLICGLIPGISFGQPISEMQRESMIALAHENFWGKAQLANGVVVQPASEAERRTLPIPKAMAHHIAYAGALSGLGKWCGLDWQAHHLAVTGAARKNGLSEMQLAFVGFLHGVAFGSTSSAMRGEICDEVIKTNIQTTLAQSQKNWMNGL